MARYGVRLERSVYKLRLSDSVRIVGAVPRAEVITHLQLADVFALPVRTRLAGLNPEGLCLAALEAAACGLPVIIGDSGGAPETVRDGETGFLVPHMIISCWRRDSINFWTIRPWRGTWASAAADHVTQHFGSDVARATLRSALEL